MEATTADDAPAPPVGPRRPRRTWRTRRAVLVGLVALVVALAAFVGITAVTGLDGPGPLRRYPTADLSALVGAVQADAGDIRTPDDCWRTLDEADGPVREIARIDHLRSRVVVRGYASDSGVIDPTTRRVLDQRLDAVLATDDRFDRAMIVLEPSPDGWSPLVSCRAVTRGWITGF